MSQLTKVGFFAGLSLIFLLPLFFLPTQIVPLGLAKVLLLVVGTVVVFVTIIISLIKHRRISLPGNFLLWGALVLPVVYIISALVGSSPTLSMFGYALESGTAGSIVIFSILFFASAYMFRDRSKLVMTLTALFSSLAIVALFVLVKVLSGGSWLTFNTFFGNMGNPVGAWTDLAMAFGLLALLTTFAVEMLPLSRRLKIFMGVFYALSVVLLVVVNFETTWMLTLGASIVLILYFATVERHEGTTLSKRNGVRMAALLMVVSLLFVFNPKIGSKDISTRVLEISKVTNSDVRPNLTATVSVMKKVLSANPILGSGPNTFERAWFLYKPAETNVTPFWSTAFPFGYGFLPTAFATMGLVGIISWVAFFVLFIMLGIRALARNLENRSDRFLFTSTFLISLFLWVGSFVYSPSLVMLALTFIFTGLFVGASEATGVLLPKEIIFNKNKLSLFASALVALVLIVGMGAFTFVSLKKVIAATHFQRALVYSNTSGKTFDEIESELGKAVTTSPSDPFWSAVSQVELSRANNALNSTEGSDATRQEAFQNALSASIAALQNAISLNPTYRNWLALGDVYESLVPSPFSVEGAYDSAKFAYETAQALHPLSPEIFLKFARLELDNKNAEGAREFITEALNKKKDYADAYFFLSQLEISQNNLRQAIESAETGVFLSPNNAGVLFQLGLLKYSNRDYKGATDALVKAIEIVPDYANAKYYLGLSLDKLGQKAEALKQFEDLAKTNPDNTAVLDVLTNLRAGRGALSDVSSEPTSKAKPPISGQ